MVIVFLFLRLFRFEIEPLLSIRFSFILLLVYHSPTYKVPRERNSVIPLD